MPSDVQVLPGVAVISFSGIATNSVVLSSNSAGMAKLIGNNKEFWEANDSENLFLIKSTLSAYNFEADTNTFDLNLDTLNSPLSVVSISAGKIYVSPYGGSGEGTYTNATPTTQTVGGIAAGTTFDNVSYDNMWTQLLYPYQEPAFSSFYFSEGDPQEVGYTIVSGNYTFTWATTNSSNVQTNSISIKDTTNSTVLATGEANDGSALVNLPVGIQKNTKATHVWTVSGYNTNSSTFTRNYTINWYFKVFYGESASSALTTSADVKGLRANNLVANSPATYAFLANNYKYIAYPSSYTTLTTFVDAATMLNVAMESYTVVSVTNDNGVTVNYNVHRTTNKLGGSINIIAS